MKKKSKYRIVVLMKQVIDTRRTNNTKETDRSKLPAIINPNDLKALEMALKIKDIFTETIVFALSMGPLRAEDILREAVARGADYGVLLNDIRFAGSDTLATSYTLSLAIKKIGEIDIILAGRQTIDGDTAHVGPQVALISKIPQITCVENLKIEGNNISARRRLSDGYENIVSQLPVVVTAHERAPLCRPVNIRRLIDTRLDSVKVWSAQDLDGKLNHFGKEGSRTIVINSIDIENKNKKAHIFMDSNQDIYCLLEKLFKENLISKRPVL